MPSAGVDLSKFEPLVPDDRLYRVVDKLKDEFGHRLLADWEWVTFVQPAREIERKTEAGIAVRTWLPEMGVFAAISDNPRPMAKASGQRLMTNATVALVDWRESEDDAGHYVGAPDHLHNILRGVVREHLRILTNLQEMI